MMKHSICSAWMILTLAAAVVFCEPAHSQSRIPAVDAVLNDIHDAASKADWNRYFSHFADDAVFLGTDPSERWSTGEFKVYAQTRGDGWTYTPRKRNVFLSKDGKTAWFDEWTDSKKYGPMRGTGVLIRVGHTWKLAQYSLTKPIPNDLFVKIVEMIQTQTDSHVPDDRSPAAAK